MFMRNLFGFSRQLMPSLLNSFKNHSAACSRTFFQNNNKVEFIKSPTINKQTSQSIVANVNKNVLQNGEGRLFAVVHLCGKQYKITAGDVVVIEGYWAPTTGDKIRLEKVLLAGGENFTLTGRPLLQPNLVDVQATIVEKTIAHTRTTFKKKRRKQYMRIKFHRSAQSMIRINSISINQNMIGGSSSKLDLSEV